MALTLYWEVGDGEVAMPAPAAASPLAAFVHLSGADPGQIIAQYDGWEAALSGLEAGDRITQRITLSVPAEAPPGTFYLRAGLYSPQSGRRLPVTGVDEDFSTLATVEIVPVEK